VILRVSPLQTVGAKQLNDLLPNIVENRGTSRKHGLVDRRVYVGV